MCDREEWRGVSMSDLVINSIGCFSHTSGWCGFILFIKLQSTMIFTL